MNLRESLRDAFRAKHGAAGILDPQCDEHCPECEGDGCSSCNNTGVVRKSDETTLGSHVGTAPQPALGRPIRPRKQTRRKKRESVNEGLAREAAMDIEDFIVQTKESLAQIKDQLRSIDPDIAERARRMWISHIEMALDDKHEWLGGSQHSAEKTMHELSSIDTDAELDDDPIVPAFGGEGDPKQIRNPDKRT